MSEEVSIPLLRELIARGAHAPEQSLQETPNDSAQDPVVDSAEHDDEIELEYHAALQQIQAEQQEIEFDTIESEPERLKNDPANEQATDNRKLLIDEEIRHILDRHMAAAYREIIELIRQKSF